MIAVLEGVVGETLGDILIISVHGVGYGLYVTHEDYGKLAVGQTAKLYTYEHIREQSYDLFGFMQLDTKKLFEQLLGVNGVGPKMALSVLSIGSSNDVRHAIAAGDTKTIQRATGVGKRVAERVIVDLKDKVGLIGVDLNGTGVLQSSQQMFSDEAIEALVSLGYSAADAVLALHDVDETLPTAERIKRALSTKKS
jgi:Holliday junction DNA helicase RuvA